MPYEKNLEDEIDWKILDQLEGAVSKISGNCFEIKKLCVTTLFIVLALLAKFTNNHIDRSLFIAGILVPLFFWALDSIGYYYQQNIRCAMEGIVERINKRNNTESHPDIAYYIISRKRIEQAKALKMVTSAFNWSMLLYGIIIFVDIILWIIIYPKTI